MVRSNLQPPKITLEALREGKICAPFPLCHHAMFYQQLVCLVCPTKQPSLQHNSAVFPKKNQYAISGGAPGTTCSAESQEHANAVFIYSWLKPPSAKLPGSACALPPSFSAKPNLCGAGQTSVEVMMMMMMMITWLIKIFRETWLRFNSSGPFFLCPSPSIPMTLQDKYGPSLFTWWGNWGRAVSGYARGQESWVRADMGIWETPSQFSILLSLPTETEIMQLCCLSLPDSSWFMVFNPQRQLHPRV